MVKNAAHHEDSLRLQALGKLVRHYQPALQEYLHRRFRFPLDQCEDILQSFFVEKLIKRNLLARADRDRGRFRSFLLAAINHHVLDQLKRESARKRRPMGGFQSFEDLLANGDEFRTEDGHEVFDETFAKQVIAEAIQRTHAHCVKRDILDVWQVFHARILSPLLEGKAPVPYEQLVEELNLAGVAMAQNRLATAKRVFQREFRQVLKDITANDRELADEIGYLQGFLQKSGKELERNS